MDKPPMAKPTSSNVIGIAELSFSQLTVPCDIWRYLGWGTQESSVFECRLTCMPRPRLQANYYPYLYESNFFMLLSNPKITFIFH